MRSLLQILVFLFFTVGCKNKNGIPTGVLPQKKMQVILWDMMRADQFLNDYIINKDSSKNKTTESLKYYQQIFTIHKISKEEFQHSFSFYKSHPVLFKMILDSISTPPNEAPTQIAQPVVIKDTISYLSDSITPGYQKNLTDTVRFRKKEKPKSLRLE